MYGEALYKPEMKEGNPIRLYSLDEITEIFCKLGPVSYTHLTLPTN